MYDNKRIIQRTRAGTGAAAGVFAGLSGVFLLSACLPLPGADGRIAHLPSMCPFRLLTGLPCPGCGLTRAFVCLSHGRFAQSLHWHPIGWLVYGVLLLLWANAGSTWLFAHPVVVLSERSRHRLSWAGAAALLLAGLVRIGFVLAHPALSIP